MNETLAGWGSKAHDEKSNDEGDDDTDEYIHFELTQQVEVSEKIDEGSDVKVSDAAVVVVCKKKRVRPIVDSENDDDVNARTSQMTENEPI